MKQVYSDGAARSRHDSITIDGFRAFSRQAALRMLPLLVVQLAVTAGCDRGADPVELPPTPVVSARESWAVVRRAYVRIQGEPAVGSSIQGHVRRGAILAVIERTPFLDTVDGQRDHWLSVAGDEISGWVFGAYVDTYTTVEQAQTASRVLRGE